MTNRPFLIEVFEDTKLRTTPAEGVEPMTVSQKYHLDDIVSFQGNQHDTQLRLWNTDSVTAAQDLAGGGFTTAILNMATPKKPGGGVRKGALAQEECLFRSSNLIHTLREDFYPLGEQEGIYTSDALFIKDVNHQLYPTPFYADVITVPAVNLNPQVDIPPPTDLHRTPVEKAHLALGLAAMHQVDALVLGAWGCGVFKNDPELMAKMLLALVLGPYEGVFQEVVFAIIDDENSVGSNYQIFKQVFMKNFQQYQTTRKIRKS
jgi:uncharacterized protein (TIGR02452 family)